MCYPGFCTSFCLHVIVSVQKLVPNRGFLFASHIHICLYIYMYVCIVEPPPSPCENTKAKLPPRPLLLCRLLKQPYISTLPCLLTNNNEPVWAYSPPHVDSNFIELVGFLFVSLIAVLNMFAIGWYMTRWAYLLLPYCSKKKKKFRIELLDPGNHHV